MSKLLKKNTIWIDWVYDGRSQNLAKRFGVIYYSLGYFSDKPKVAYVFLRYLLASFKTISLIITKNPKVVIMTGSPPFPHFIVYYLSKIKKIKFIIDTHSGYFDDKKFHILPELRKKIMAEAFFHIVTNDMHKKIIESNNGRGHILGVLIEDENDIKGYNFVKDNNFVWISGYHYDEPLEIVFDVAKRMPDVNIYITGNIKKAPKIFVEKSSLFNNIILTGFLSEKIYISYIKGSTGVIALTTRDNTMQRGAYEALSYNTPIITSNWNLLKESFFKGTVHINNTAVELEEAIRSICNNRDKFRAEIEDLKNTHKKYFDNKISEINTLLHD